MLAKVQLEKGKFEGKKLKDWVAYCVLATDAIEHHHEAEGGC